MILHGQISKSSLLAKCAQRFPTTLQIIILDWVWYDPSCYHALRITSQTGVFIAPINSKHHYNPCVQKGQNTLHGITQSCLFRFAVAPLFLFCLINHWWIWYMCLNYSDWWWTDWRGGLNNQKASDLPPQWKPGPASVVFSQPLTVARNDKHCCGGGERIRNRPVTTSEELVKFLI